MLDLTNRGQSHSFSFSFFKIKGENVKQEYATIKGKWLRMSRLEREPNLKKSLQSERSSLLNNTDLRSQIMDVKYRYKQQLSPIEQQKDIFPSTKASYRINITLLNNIAATEHKLLFLNHRLDQIYS